MVLGAIRFDDGGVANQVFLYDPMLNPLAGVKELGFDRLRRKSRVYVIRNTQAKPTGAR
jgi:hypothetical protein